MTLLKAYGALSGILAISDLLSFGAIVGQVTVSYFEQHLPRLLLEYICRRLYVECASESCFCQTGSLEADQLNIDMFVLYSCR